MVYNSQHSFAKCKDIDEFKELSLDSMYKKLNDFQKRFSKLKIVNPQADNNKGLKEKVLNSVGDIFNELYYIYKDKYNEEQQTSKKPHKEKPPKKLDKKERTKKPTKDDLREFNEWVNKKEISINSELFKRDCNLQRRGDMLKLLYNTNDKKKNSNLVNVIKSGLNDLKKEIEKMSED